MYCNRCGTAMEDEANICRDCGEPVDRRGRPAAAGYPQAAQASYAAAMHDPSVSSRSRLAMLLLCFFLGTFGAHRFFAGRIVTGILWFCTIGLLGLGWLYDMILILCGAFRDGDGRVIARWE